MATPGAAGEWATTALEPKPMGASGRSLAATREEGNGLDIGKALESNPPGGANGKKEREVATPGGWWRGKSFEGYGAGGNCRRAALETESSSAGNPANPRVGSGMQQARKVHGGASRQSGEKPQRRNAIRGWHPRTEVPATRERSRECDFSQRGS